MNFRLKISCMLFLLTACGSEVASVSFSDRPRELYAATSTDGGYQSFVETQKSESDAADSGTADAGTISDASNDIETSCSVVVGHCITHMGTLCYETSYDATEECSLTGQSTGWFLGPCPTERSSGGCKVGCTISYSYPLAGNSPTDATRAAVKEACLSMSDGIFIDTSSSNIDHADAN